MNYKPPRRDYKQMVRIVRDKPNSSISYKMGNAYGEKHSAFGFDNADGTQVRIRTLNEMNIASTSPRRPEDPAMNGFLPTRESSILYHDLNDSTQRYLSGQGGAQATRRGDGSPGTKLRTELGKDAFEQKILTQAAFTPAQTHTTGEQDGKKDQGKDGQKTPQNNFTAFKS